MSGRGPDPKDVRASLVDSGWSVTPPPKDTAAALPKAAAPLPPPPTAGPGVGLPPPPTVAFVDAEPEPDDDEVLNPDSTLDVSPSEAMTRRLPTYEEQSPPAITQVDRNIGDRVKEM